MRFFVSIFVFLMPIYLFGESLKPFLPLEKEEDALYGNDELDLSVDRPVIEILVRFVNDTPVVIGYKQNGIFYPVHTNDHLFQNTSIEKEDEDNDLNDLSDYAFNKDAEPVQNQNTVQDAPPYSLPAKIRINEESDLNGLSENELSDTEVGFGMHPLDVVKAVSE